MAPEPVIDVDVTSPMYLHPEVKPVSQLRMESSAMNVAAGNYQHKFQAKNYNDRGTYSRERRYCEHCHKMNHTIDNCWDLIGYPDDRKGKSVPSNKQNFGQKFKPNGNYFRGPSLGRYSSKGKVANVHGMQEQLSEGGGDGDFSGDGDHAANITKEEYGQLMNILKQFKGNLGGEASNCTNIPCGAVNFAGPFNEEASGNW